MAPAAKRGEQSVPLNSETRTRKQYLKREVLEPIVADIDAYGDDWVDDNAEETLAREDERIWAWARDPKTDLTQVEARDRAQSHKYGRHNLSQSSVSRKVNQLDEEILTEPVLVLELESSLVEYEQLQNQERHAPELADAWRAWLARTICDYHALSIAGDWSADTPDWARERLPGVEDNTTERLTEAYD